MIWMAIGGIILAYLLTIECVFSYKSKKIRAYNKGYQSGYEDTLRQAMDHAENVSREICGKYSSQFKSEMVKMPPSTVRTINEIPVPFSYKMHTFDIETYGVTFTIQPAHHRYATYINDKI